AFSVPDQLRVLPRLKPQNAQGEYYLTDVIGLLVGEGLAVRAVLAPDATEALGVNSHVELAEAARLLRTRRAQSLMEAGVRLEDPGTIDVGLDVEVEADAVIR